MRKGGVVAGLLALAFAGEGEGEMDEEREPARLGEDGADGRVVVRPQVDGAERSESDHCGR